MIDFFISSLDLWLEMNQFPQVVTVDIFRIWSPHLDFCHRDQNLRVRIKALWTCPSRKIFCIISLYLISNNLNLCCRRLTWASLKQQKLWRNHFNQENLQWGTFSFVWVFLCRGTLQQFWRRSTSHEAPNPADVNRF